MKFLLLSLEFDAGTFSGNGVYACSQARALCELGHEVVVVAGAPRGADVTASRANASRRGASGSQRVLHIELTVWGRLDAGCAWREYAAGTAVEAVTAEVAAFGAAAVLGVDWHSVGAYDALAGALPPGTLPPFVYLNYRVYHRTAAPAELALIEGQEARALRLACCSLVLSRSDADYLRTHFGAALAPSAPLHVLLPALRSDMERLPPPALPAAEDAGAAAAAWAAGRRYLACCVRLSPEKEPHRFVEVLKELQRRGSLHQWHVTPAMCGAGWGTDYGRHLRERLQQHVPQCVIHDTFMGPRELAALYRSTLLNLHPPTYDAYGMTIVEAASQGAPSLVQAGGHVGATDLLSAEAGEVLLCDMGAPAGQLADLVEQLLADRARLAAVGRASQAKARSWTERNNASALVGHVRDALAQLASVAAEPGDAEVGGCAGNQQAAVRVGA